MERILYTAFWIINKPEVIAGWLVLKAIGEWNPKNIKKIDVVNREQIIIFLIGTAISLMFGVAGGIVFNFVLDPNYLLNLINGS